MNPNEFDYNYIKWLLPINYLDNDDIDFIANNGMNCDVNFYDIITVDFTKPHSHEYILKPYGAKIKMYGSSDEYIIERKHLLNPEYKSSPYVLVKLSSGKFGYLHTGNFDPIEFESQDIIKDKLIEFLLK